MRQLVYSHTGESQERGRAGPQASAGSIGQRGGLRASEALWAINRDKLTCMALAGSKTARLLHDQKPALQYIPYALTAPGSRLVAVTEVYLCDATFSFLLSAYVS